MDLSQKAIENLYVGKSKIPFQYFSDTGKYYSKYETLNPNTTFSAIGSKLDFEGQPIKSLNSYLPSYVVNGFMRINKDGLFIDKNNLKIYLDDIDSPENLKGVYFEPVKLYITTVPKKAFSINPCLLKSCLEARYYEDQVRGYLFQIITNDQISLIQYSYQCNYSFKITFEKDGSPRLHRKV